MMTKRHDMNITSGGIAPAVFETLDSTCSSAPNAQHVNASNTLPGDSPCCCASAGVHPTCIRSKTRNQLRGPPHSIPLRACNLGTAAMKYPSVVAYVCQTHISNSPERVPPVSNDGIAFGETANPSGRGRCTALHSADLK